MLCLRRGPEMQEASPVGHSRPVSEVTCILPFWPLPSQLSDWKMDITCLSLAKQLGKSSGAQACRSMSGRSGIQDEIGELGCREPGLKIPRRQGRLPEGEGPLREERRWLPEQPDRAAPPAVFSNSQS